MRRHAISFALAVLLALTWGNAAHAAARFSAADNTVIRVYFATKPVVWSGLPPQVARDFGRGKALPGRAEAHPLPVDLLARLPTHRGFEYARVGADVVLIDRATRVVVDVIESVFN